MKISAPSCYYLSWEYQTKVWCPQFPQMEMGRSRFYAFVNGQSLGALLAIRITCFSKRTAADTKCAETRRYMLIVYSILSLHCTEQAEVANTLRSHTRARTNLLQYLFVVPTAYEIIHRNGRLMFQHKIGHFHICFLKHNYLHRNNF